MQQQMNICLFGGTFDPIHLGHTYIAQLAQRQFSLDKVIFLPCRQSPHKSEPNAASDAARLTMCQLATAPHPWAEVSDYDLTAPAPSYSWRTAEYFKKLYPGARLFWLMGTDQWESLTRWNRASHFASLVEIIVFYRKHAPRPIEGFHYHPLNNIQHPASATQIRAALTHSRTSPWLHSKNATFIKENNLYTKSSLD